MAIYLALSIGRQVNFNFIHITAKLMLAAFGPRGLWVVFLRGKLGTSQRLSFLGYF